MKKIKYELPSAEANHGTEDSLNIKPFEKYITWNEVNEEIAKREAYNGEYTIEDDGQPEPVPEPTIWDELATAYQEGVNEV